MKDTKHLIADSYSSGRLHARAHPPLLEPEISVGTHMLRFANNRIAHLHIPRNYDRAVPAPLLAIFHGVNGLDGGVVKIAIELADRYGVMLIAQKSIAMSWDILRGTYGQDLEFIDFLLRWAMQRFAIDPDCIGIAGFSDGASYALSVGLTNGDLFHDILAFSPGFLRPMTRHGQPRIFIAHGTSDPVLPVSCGQRIAYQLAHEGYDMRYQEFEGGHIVQQPIAEMAMNRFLS